MREVRRRLGRQLFVPEPRRLGWLFLHLSLLFGGILGARALVVANALPLLALLPLGLVLGLSVAGLAFVAHETLHGAVIKNRGWMSVVGTLGFLPFCVTPRLWVAWHNRVHHGHTNLAGRDPDAYATLEEYQSSPATRWAIVFGAPRSGKWRGVITLLLGFTLQSFQILLTAPRRQVLSARDHRLAVLQSGLTFLGWCALGFWLGPVMSLFLLVLPLLVGNVIVMAHIVTNHSLSPLDSHNDPLESSLSVTAPRWFQIYTLGFGYHVEHHLFPSMSHRHGPAVSKVLRELAPQRYQRLPLLRALGLVFRTPRVYRDTHTLWDPKTQQRFVTLGPSALVTAAAVGSVLLPVPGGQERPERPLAAEHSSPAARPASPTAVLGSAPAAVEAPHSAAPGDPLAPPRASTLG